MKDTIKPAAVAGNNLPALLLGYQQRLIQKMAVCPVVFCEKSRRIGVTWGMAADAVLTAASSKAAKGMDVFYIGFNLDMTREFIGTAADWAKKFSYAATDVEEYVFKDINENGDTKEIQAFRIRFDSGFEINALTSRPRSLRGRQGYIIIDEAAFHDDLKELMKAALAMLIWGGKVLVISTHDGASNPFNEYIKDARAGRSKYEVVRIDLDDALADGLYQRICLTTGKEWSPEAQAAWRDELVSFYGEGASEELFCVPKQSSGTFLPSVLVESRMEEVPVIRFECSKEFVHRPAFEREKEVLEWCLSNLKPYLDLLDDKLAHYFGEDFGRSGDLTILWPVVVQQNLKRRTPFVVELRNVPFAQQKQILWFMVDRLPRFCAGALDARGNGQQMAEETMQRYGAGRIFMVMITQAWYLDALPKYKAAIEDNTMSIPKDADILNDHRAAVIQNGIPQIPSSRTKGQDGGKRHGDSLVAAAMAYWATLQAISEYGYTTADSHARRASSLRNDNNSDSDRRQSHAFGSNTGAW